MLIPKELINEAKGRLGEEAATIIAEDLFLEEFDKKGLKAICPFHEEDTGSFIWNPKNNSYKCFGCNRVYGIIDHYKEHHKLNFLGAVEKLFKEVGVEYRFNERGLKQREYRHPQEETSREAIVEEYWQSRGISKEILDYANVQSDEFGNTAFHYYDLNDVLCMAKYRPSKKVNKGENKFWAQKDADTMPLLYGMHQADPTQPLTICEGEPDRLSLMEAGFRNAVSVPFGANNYSWIEECWDFLEQFDKIIVWADNDPAGLKMRKEVCSRLGSWRTLFVDTEELKAESGYSPKDINEVLYLFGKDQVLKCIDNAQEIPVQNVVDLADVDDFDIETELGLFTGLKELDGIIYKFLFGSVVILTGAKGSGKSSFLNQVFVCEPLDQGYDVFLYSGEMANPVIRNWVETTMAGRENIIMKNDFVRIIDENARKKMREWYRGRVWNYDGIDNDSNIILDRAISVTRRFGVKVWILDNLMSLDIGSNGTDIYERQKEFITKIVNLAKLYGVLVILVAHPRKTSELRRLVADDVAGSNDLGNAAQYIIGSHRYSEREKMGEKTRKGEYIVGKEPINFDMAMEVFKNRYTGKIGECQLHFDYPSYRFYDTQLELDKRYKWNSDTTIPNLPLPKTEELTPSEFH